MPQILDTVLVTCVAVMFLMKAILIRRETYFGWVMMFQALSLFASFSYVVMRRFWPFLDYWPLTAIRVCLFVSCILVIAVLIHERIMVSKPEIQSRKIVWRRERVVGKREVVATKREDTVTAREDCMDERDAGVVSGDVDRE